MKKFIKRKLLSLMKEIFQERFTIIVEPTYVANQRKNKRISSLHIYVLLDDETIFSETIEL